MGHGLRRDGKSGETRITSERTKQYEALGTKD